MSVRSDLETRLEQWASSQSPPIEIAWEGLDYTKPSSGVFLQPILSPAQPRLAGLSGTRYRDIGMFHINIWGLDGKGAENRSRCSIPDKFISSNSQVW